MRKVFAFCIAVSLTLYACGDAWAQQDPIRVIVYGDDLTSGYELQPEQSFPAKLEQKLKAVGFSNVPVINMSISGETTAEGLGRINSLLEQQPDIVVLELGTNDAQRGIDIKLIHYNLATILSKLVERRIYVILVGDKAPSSLGYQYNTQFKEIYELLAQAFKVPLYPFALDGIAGNPDLNLADGLHPNAKGVMVMVEQIYPLVDSAVRWKWEVQQQYQDWMRQNQGLPSGFVPSPPPPPPVTP